MTDRYQPLRDAIAARSWPVGDSFQRNMGLVEELLKERDHFAEECHEQARLLGMGGSRELALRTAMRGLLDALPSSTTHPEIAAARAALAAGEDA